MKAPCCVSAGIVTVIFAGHPAWACSCGTPSAETLKTDYVAIFTGKALASVPASGGEAVSTFRVVEGFKGAAPGEIVRVRHRSGASASCGVTFEAGKMHTLAAYRESVGTSLFANLCTVWFFRVDGGEALKAQLRSSRR